MKKMLMIAVGLLVLLSVGAVQARAGVVLSDATYAARGRTIVLNPADRPLEITRGEDFAISVRIANTTLQSPCDSKQCYVTADLISADSSKVLLDDLARHREWIKVWLGTQSCPITAYLSGMIPEKGSESGVLLKEGRARLVIRLFHMKKSPSVLDYDVELGRLEMPVIIR